MKVLKTTYIEVSIMEQIEDHMKTHNIKFAEFIRRAVAHYLDHNQNVTEVSINDNPLPTEGHEPVEQLPEIKPETNKDIKNGFNWDGVNID